MRYQVEITETITHTIYVEAEDEVQAKQIGYDQYHEGQDTFLDGVDSYDIESEGDSSHSVWEMPE